MRAIVSSSILLVVLAAGSPVRAQGAPPAGKMVGECTKAGLATMALLPLGMPGSATMPASAREDIAKSLENMSEKLSAQNVKDDLRDMAAEVRAQAGNAKMADTPRFAHAMGDYKQWLKDNCGDTRPRRTP